MNTNNIKPFEFDLNVNTMATGFTAQELDEVYISIDSSTVSTIDLTIDSISPSTITYDSMSSGTFIFDDPYTEIQARLNKLEKIIADEEELRAKHPTVKQAYDEYKLLATLAKIHSNDLTDE